MSLKFPLGEAFRGVEIETTEEKRRKEMQATFDRVLKDRFASVPEGFGFKPGLPGIDSIVIIRPTPPINLNIHIRYRVADGTSRGETLSLDNEGHFMGRLPKALQGQVTKEKILAEVVSKLEDLKFKDWIELEQEFFPPGVGSPKVDMGPGKPRGPKPPPDPRRIELIVRQPHIQALFLGKKGGGFGGYRGAVFPNFVTLDNAEVDNAIYFLDIPPFSMPEGLSRQDQIDYLLKQEWMELISGSREQARVKGAKHLRHTGEWVERFEQEFKRRFAELEKK